MIPDNYPTQPAHLWQHFYRITQIPRPSRQEQAVRQYVIDQAEPGGHGWRMDDRAIWWSGAGQGGHGAACHRHYPESPGYGDSENRRQGPRLLAPIP